MPISLTHRHRQGFRPYSAAPKFALLVRREYLAFDALLHTQLRRTFDKSSEDKEKNSDTISRSKPRLATVLCIARSDIVE